MPAFLPTGYLYTRKFVPPGVSVYDGGVRIVWDEPKRLRNLRPEPEGHGLDFRAVEDGFDFGTALVSPTKPGSDGRPRFRALGDFDGRLHALFFALLGAEAISLISFRPASAKERKTYDDAQG